METGTPSKAEAYEMQGVYSKGLSALGMFFVLWCGIFGSQSNAATYYLSPTGSDSNAGTSSSPWRTFAFAPPKLRPGDTLILKDGIYNASNSGFVSINCSSGSSNGNASAPITIKAENERQAHISGDGSTYPFLMQNCSYWNISGLYISNADKTPSAAPEGNAIKLYNCHHLYVNRLLVFHNNRYYNGALFFVSQTDYSLFEENEMYYYHRNGMNSANHNVFRRNYINSRGALDLPNCVGFGMCSNGPGGDSGFICYPGSYNLFENNIAENTADLIHIEALGSSGATIGNKFLGCLGVNNTMGMQIRARGSDAISMPTDTIFKDMVLVNSSATYGAYFRGNKNTQISNSTFVGNPMGGVYVDHSTGEPGDGVYSWYGTNILSLNNGGYGFNITGMSDWLLDYPSAYGNPNNSNPAASDSHITHETTANPQMGTCYAWIPAGSRLKGAGKNGADIGANVLYRYENGILTSTPLWDPSTGAFPCGAIVAGVNDVPGDSCFDVHTRFNINCNGCSFPSGYGQGTRSQMSPPTVKIVSVQN